jgi:hypothetical protein
VAAVRAYLEAIEASKPRTERARARPDLKERLDEIEQENRSTDVITFLSNTEERISLIEELEWTQDRQGELKFQAIEEAFVANAGAFGHAKGITWAGWRAVGVPAALLDRAGVPRTDHGK